MSECPVGSKAKVYYDIDGNPRPLFWMVRNEFDWAASRIIEGEKAIAENARLRKVAIKLYNLGYHSGHETVAEILKDEGVLL